jgi:uncharacterized membrane protein
MGSKPKKSDYEASSIEKFEASQALFDYNRDRSLYRPVMQEWKEEVATTKDPQAIASRVASADTMQTLAGRPSLAAAQSVDAAANIASGAVAQHLQGQKQALGVQRGMQLGALEMGKNRKAVTKLGLSDVAKQERSEGLGAARREQLLAETKLQGGLQLGTTFAYAKKFGTWGGKPDEAAPEVTPDKDNSLFKTGRFS